jgi:iron complex outermembrane receptor protein
MPAMTTSRRQSEPLYASLRAFGFAAGMACAALPARAAGDLTALGLEQLMALTVVGASKYEQRQNEVAAAVTIITRSEIKAHGWRTLADVLGSLPGVHVTYDRQYTYLGTRGFGIPGDSNVRLLLTVNGNRINDPLYDGASVGRELPLDLDLVERIEFIAGPGGAVYGQNAMFGVVNIVTRSGADVNGAELAVAAEHAPALREGRATWGRRLANGVDVLVSMTGQRAAGADRFYDYGAAGVSGVATGLDAERDRELFARIAGGRWHFDFTHGSRRKDDPTAGFLSDPLVAGQHQSDAYTVAQLRYSERLRGDTLQLTGRVFSGRYRYDSILSYGTLFAFPAQADWHGTEWSLVSTAVAGHKMMLGFEAQRNARTDQFALDLAAPANDIRIPASGRRVGVYLQDEWRLHPVLTATFGLRVDDDGALRTSPRAGLIWQPAAATTLKALYGRAHRAPNMYESRYTDGLALVANPALAGERIDTFEIVADRRVGRELGLRASIYEWTMHDQITLGTDPVSGLSQYRSGGTVRARGVELSADRTWASGARLRGSVSRQQVDDSTGVRLPNSPRWLAKLAATAPLPFAGLRLGWELRCESSRRTLAGAEIGGHAVSNLHLVTDALGEDIELSFGVHNLFDRRYAHPGADTNWQDALQQDGRNVRVALTARF